MKTIIADIPSREAFLKGRGALEKSFIYPEGEIYTFDELRYSGRGTRICKIA
jgi:hypothetical protein